jgi:hypothetical protein
MIVDHKIEKFTRRKYWTNSNEDYSTTNELFQFKLVKIIACTSTKKIHDFQINLLCTILYNFVDESTCQILSNFRSSTFNEDISVINADSCSKLISLVAQFLFYMLSHFGARVSFPALYKNRRVKAFLSSVIFGKWSFLWSSKPVPYIVFKNYIRPYNYTVESNNLFKYRNIIAIIFSLIC